MKLSLIWEPVLLNSYSKPHREAFAMNRQVLSTVSSVSSAVDINIEIGGMLAEDKFDGEIGGKHGYDGVASLTAGLTYRFPARRICPSDATDYF